MITMEKKQLMNEAHTIINKYSKIFYYPFLIVLVLTLVFFLMEWKYPYYFLQDDSRSYFFPLFIHDYRSLLNGEIPLYNFYQYLGEPLLSNGQPGPLYPVTYIAVFLSKLLLGHFFATIEIYVFINLIIASSGFFAFLRFLGLDEKSAFFGAITWSLSSYIIYATSTCAEVSGLAAYFPWIIYFSLKIYNKFSYGNLIGLVFSRLILFYVGHPQWFLYAILFEFLTIAALFAVELRNVEGKGKQPLGNKSKQAKQTKQTKQAKKAITFSFRKNSDKFFNMVKYSILSYICTFILSLPFLLPVWHQMTISAARSSRFDWKLFIAGKYNIADWIQGLIFPFSSAGNAPPEDSWLYLHNLSHIGYITIFFIIVCLAAFVFKTKNFQVKRSYIIAFLIVGLISFLLAGNIIIHYIIFLIPVFNRFKQPYRIIFFTNFYLISLASIGYYSFFKNYIQNKIGKIKLMNILFCSLIILHIINFSYLYVFFPQKAFGIHLDKVPFEEPLEHIINDGRFISLGFSLNEENPGNWTLYAYTAPSLTQNFATLWKLYNFTGYEPLMSKDTAKATLGLDRDSFSKYLYNQYDIPFDYFRSWGVKWYVVSNNVKAPDNNDLLPKFKDQRRTVYLDPKARPLFFWQSRENSEGITYKINSNSIELKVNNETDDYLVVNFLHNPFFKALLNGKHTGIDKTEIGQMVVHVPKGSHNIFIKYSDPYFSAGLFIALAFILVIAAFSAFKLIRKFRKEVVNNV